MKAVRMKVVDNIMSTPVSIDETKTVKEAVDIMDKEGTKKILVTSNGAPKGALEMWKICCDDYDLKISQIQPLGKIRVVPRGTEVSTIERDLIEFSAIYVSEPRDRNNIVGVVTSPDLVKSF